MGVLTNTWKSVPIVGVCRDARMRWQDMVLLLIWCMCRWIYMPTSFLSPTLSWMFVHLTVDSRYRTCLFVRLVHAPVPTSVDWDYVEGKCAGGRGTGSVIVTRGSYSVSMQLQFLKSTPLPCTYKPLPYYRDAHQRYSVNTAANNIVIQFKW